jgi:hypothetical protein
MHLPRLRAAAVLAAALLASGPARAADEVNTVPGLSAAGAPLALHGYDPVAYFTEGRPARGADQLAVVHDGVAYRFASAAHRARFVQDPARFLPQYGGFCAYGVALGKKFDGDPQLWNITDGKLYLNLNEETYAAFLKDVDGNVRKADGIWPGIVHVEAGKL